MTVSTEPIVRFDQVVKSYDEVVAVDELDLTIEAGEFLSLLGPSGCGKTTTLRLLGGFESPTRGTLTIDGQDMSDVPPYRRPVNTVFQSYALFPHLSVAENVAYGLRRRGMKKRDTKPLVGEALDMVGLAEYGERSPRQLSGGQQQRVALARCLVNKPKVLLLDEPLGALDLKLRRHMQMELKHIHAELGTTFVYVTHDQEEALTMSDRIAVMNEGRIEQLGTGADLYDHPATPFVADFIGTTNLLDAVVESADADRTTIGVDGTTLTATSAGGASVGNKVKAMIRPEQVLVDPSADSVDNVVSGTIRERVFLGSQVALIVDCDKLGRLEARLIRAGRQVPDTIGDPVTLGWNADDCIVVSA